MAVAMGVAGGAYSGRVAIDMQQIDRLLAVKLEELKPETVKRMMEEVIRRHLGWLVLWGNVFGGLIGLITAAVRHLYP